MKYDYLRLLESKKIRPNFWCSEEYFDKAGFKEIRGGATSRPSVTIEDADGQLILPPLNTIPGTGWLPLEKNVWAGLNGFEPIDGAKKFLDSEYIYDPTAFLDMRGKKWQTFRKNCRKFPKRHRLRFTYNLLTHPPRHKVVEFVNYWMGASTWDEFHDAEVMIKYIYEGKNREVLVDYTGDIHGINIWDESYMYINYRYCLCVNLPFLSEYMRYLFYINKAGQAKLINDGGILDRPELKRFKDKLNPVQVNDVYSWKL